MTDQVDIRIGQLALQAGFVTDSDLDDLLVEQDRRAHGGGAPKLGQLMVELGYVTPRQVQRLLGAQAVVAAQVSRIGPYHLIAKLGEGGMGAVYHAQDIRNSEQVALKVLPRSKARDPEFLARFESEARAIFELDHPNIVRAVGLGEADGYHYLALEYVDGKDVYDLLDDQGRISEHDTLSIVIQITRALEHAHEEHVVHRDIKPGNILVDRHGMAKLTDFGLALDREREGRNRITASHEALGTPFYLSPEQARGESDIDIRSDIYSLGATAYEMVTGHPPFDGTPAEVMAKHLNEQIPSPRDIDRTLSHGLCMVIQKMMAKRVEDRYQNPRELLKDLMLVYRGEEPSSASIPPARSSVRESSRPVRRYGPDRDHRRRRHAAPLAYPGVRDSFHTPAPRKRNRPQGLLSWIEGRAHMVAFGSLGIAVAAVVMAAAIYVSRSGKQSVAMPSPPSKDGLRLMTGFETATTEGWAGVATSSSAGQGSYSLVVPAAASPATGLATRMDSVSFVAGGRVEIAFLYYLESKSPIIVELRDKDSRARVCHIIAHPVLRAWTPARVVATEFTFVPAGASRSLQGRTLQDLMIRATDAPKKSSFALDSVWLWSQR